MLVIDTDTRPRYSEAADLKSYSTRTMVPRCRVMVVDDDEWMRDYLAAILQSASYEVEVVDSGREALQRLRHGVYDILLTDCMMPEMDGLALCQRVRVEFVDKCPYILMFSVREGFDARSAGLKSGADEYIVKRTPRSELLAKLNLGRQIQLGLQARTHDDASGRGRQSFDPITGAHDLAYFAQQMPEEIQRSVKSHRALSVLSCQMQGLENLTRQYGYPLADEIRRAFVAAVSSRLCSGRDWIARVDDERFMVVLPNTRFKTAERLARKLYRRFAAMSIVTAAGSIRFPVKIDVTACEPKETAVSRIGGTPQYRLPPEGRKH